MYNSFERQIQGTLKNDDFVQIASILRQHLPEKDMPYILDIDLDFFSTKNPFLNIYERANLYEKLKKLYSFNRPASSDPEILKEISVARNEQLTELEGLFTILQQERNFYNFDEPKTPRFDEVLHIYHEMHRAYTDAEIDWLQVHDAGCTIDDTELPHHVTSKADLDRLIEGTFKTFLNALPTIPTIVTVARSSEDEYCPAEDVEQIQNGVLDELSQRMGYEVEIRHDYLEEEIH